MLVINNKQISKQKLFATIVCYQALWNYPIAKVETSLTNTHIGIMNKSTLV